MFVYNSFFFSALSSEKYHPSSTLGPGDLRNVTDIGEATMSGKSGKHVSMLGLKYNRNSPVIKIDQLMNTINFICFGIDFAQLDSKGYRY